MDYRNYNHSVRCTFCGKANAKARVTQFDMGNKIIFEAKYQCPLCMNLVKREQIGEEEKPKK